MGTTSLAQPKMATEQIENIIFALGNPLLDISAPVDEAWLTKYNLKANDAILAAEEHDALFEELAQEDAVTYTAGGATMNSIRVAQYYLDNPRATTFVGCVGSDDNASKLSGAAAADSVRVEYLVDDTTPTGMCACVITGKNRSLWPSWLLPTTTRRRTCRASPSGSWPPRPRSTTLLGSTSPCAPRPCSTLPATPQRPRRPTPSTSLPPSSSSSSRPHEPGHPLRRLYLFQRGR